jgi:cyclophilin family peptidyl-prolyl cis-trans isomerase
MPNKRTRQRQLQKLADRRAAERRAQRRNRIIIWVTAAAVFLGGGAFAVIAFLGGDEGESARPEAGPSPTPTETSESPEDTGDVACDAEVPRLAGEEKPQFDKAPDTEIDQDATYTATMQTSCGTVEIELYAKETPVTVNSFVFLARQGFFDGLTFHRVVPGFVIQGGDPVGDGTGGPGYQFENEEVDGLDFDRAGLLAMANSGPDTNGSQFFITLAETPNLNEGYTMFGEVTDGMDAVDAIAALGSGDGPPSQPVYIEKVTIQGP